MTKLSVVIPTFNRRSVLERSLSALLDQDLPAEDFEIIVVDDGSTDDTSELLRGWKAHCAFRSLQSPHRGASSARNLGIQAASGDLILFLDDDLIGAKDLLRQHCASHSLSEVRIVNGRIRTAPNSAKTVVRHLTGLADPVYLSIEPVMDAHDPKSIPPGITVIPSIANSSMPRDLLLRSGGFDEKILAAEDLELKLRLWKMGASFRYQPAAVAYELYDKSSWQYLWTQARALGAGDIRTSRKHPEYRPYSALSTLGTTGTAKRWLRSALMRSPVSPVWFLALPLRLEKWYYRCGPLRSAGARLFILAARIAQLRSALSVAGSCKALKQEFGILCPGLMYHHVGPSHPGTFRELTVSPKQFEGQIRWLARWGYTGIKPSDWLRWRREGTGLPRKPILITFDDAYAETAEYALPILRRYGFGAAVFVVTERIGGTNTWDEAEGCGTLQLMTAEQIRYWAAEGIEFGAHGRTHADLTQLPADKCAAEIAGSKSDLANLLGALVVSFAYPYGHVSETVRELVRAEFDLAFGVDEGLNCLRDDPHLLKRRYVGPDDLLLDVAVGFRWRREARWLSDLRIKLGLRSRLKRALGRLGGRSSDRK